VVIAELRAGYLTFDHQDKEDALICVLIAALFASQRRFYGDHQTIHQYLKGGFGFHLM
jgi:hypothetical protein